MSRKKDGLSESERDLFARAMADVKKLKPSDRKADPTPEVVQKADGTLPAEWLDGAGLSGQRGFTHPGMARGKAAVGKPHLSPKEGIERKTRRALTKGREQVDRTIDLHGLNQVNAFSVLVRTIERAVLRDMKTVLVITGKGGRRYSQTASGSAADRTRADFDMEGGVLRRMVPMWLQSDVLRPFVESYASAAPSHGGDGALYVRLRRRRADRGDGL